MHDEWAESTVPQQKQQKKQQQKQQRQKQQQQQGGLGVCEHPPGRWELAFGYYLRSFFLYWLTAVPLVAFVLGTYLYLSCNVLGNHWNESFRCVMFALNCLPSTNGETTGTSLSAP